MARMFRMIALAATAALLLTACNKTTPEERLEKMAEASKQGDALTAELEARKLIEKHPDDPAALKARLQLATIYQADGRLDEAAEQYQAALDAIPPGSTESIQVMSLYNQVLKQQQRYPEALALVEKYEKEFTTNTDVMLNMKVARADLKASAGETSEARTLLRQAMDMTTHPGAQVQFRDLYLQTFARDKDTTGAIAFLKEQIASDLPEPSRRQFAHQLAMTTAETGNYEETRRALELGTRMTEEALTDELDQRSETQILYDLAGTYQATGNLPGAERVFLHLYKTNTDPSFGPYIVPALFQLLVREGKKDEALMFIRQANARYQAPQLQEQVVKVEAGMPTGQFDMKDTSPLTLRFAADELLIPEAVRQSGGVTLGELGQTTGTATATADTVPTTAPLVSPDAAAAPADTASQPLETPAQPPAEAPAPPPAPETVTNDAPSSPGSPQL